VVFSSVKSRLAFERKFTKAKFPFTRVRISFIFRHFHTPKICISRSSTFQTLCALFRKTGGYTPKERIPGETLFRDFSRETKKGHGMPCPSLRIGCGTRAAYTRYIVMPLISLGKKSVDFCGMTSPDVAMFQVCSTLQALSRKATCAARRSTASSAAAASRS
jgi:hypothetical protein